VVCLSPLACDIIARIAEHEVSQLSHQHLKGDSMKQRIKVLRYLASSLAVSLACGLVSFAQQASGGQQPKTAAPATMEKAPLKEFPGGRVDALAAEWTRAKNWTKEYLDKMPEDGLAFKPIPEVRSFAEQMLHLASANFFYGATATGAKAPYTRQDLTPDKFKTKADLTRIVLESYDFAINSLKAMDAAKLDERITVRGMSVPRVNVLLMGFEHQTHHRGQTTIYLRMKGVTPPPEPF
jgi:uncharacterized damage-inducible protein DinB